MFTADPLVVRRIAYRTAVAFVLCSAHSSGYAQLTYHDQIPQSFQAPPHPASQRQLADDKLTQLKSHAEKTKEQDRGRVYSDIARELTEVANQEFVDGHPEQAQASIKDAVSYAKKATEAAKQHNKKLKDTEINLRECARRLDDIRKSVNADEQPPVKQAVVRIDELRKELLDRMFRK